MFWGLVEFSKGRELTSLHYIHCVAGTSRGKKMHQHVPSEAPSHLTIPGSSKHVLELIFKNTTLIL